MFTLLHNQLTLRWYDQTLTTKVNK